MSQHAEKDAQAMWNSIPASDHDAVDLESFTKFVNEKYGRRYDPREFRSILRKLNEGRQLGAETSETDG
jgi:Ca2+-binding EF-hand superfamily protein